MGYKDTNFYRIITNGHSPFQSPKENILKPSLTKQRTQEWLPPLRSPCAAIASLLHRPCAAIAPTPKYYKSSKYRFPENMTKNPRLPYKRRATSMDGVPFWVVPSLTFFAVKESNSHSGMSGPKAKAFVKS